jgi:zinc transport system ATP-binding protein
MIRSENLCFSYNGSAPYILDNISLYIKDGEYVSILGENGSGKSTLIKLMLKLLKPTRGTIVCDTRRIGYVPQKNDFSNAQFPITVYEMLNSYRKLLRIKGKNDIIESLNWVRMSEYKDALVGTLSGGQCQKIFIARALIGNPQLLILDEPSTGVDANSQKEIYGFIKKVNSENGITIVSVEHNLDAAIKNSTLIYHLSAGHGHLCTPQKYINEFLNSGDGDEAGA